MSVAKKNAEAKSEAKDVLSVLDQKWRGSFTLEHVGILESEPPEAVLALAKDKGLEHVVQFAGSYYKVELNSSALILNEPSIFEKFPVSSVLNPSNVSLEMEKTMRLYEKNFSKIKEKKTLLSDITEIFDKEIKSNSIKSDLTLIADELITNAVYNAPFVKAGDSAGARRGDESIEMHEGMCGQVFIGSDEGRILVGCRDPYGSLDLKRLFERIMRCYESGVSASINMSGTGGAGIGSYMIYNSCVSFYVGVRSGKSTVICCVLPKKASGRARAEMPKNLHFFNY